MKQLAQKLAKSIKPATTAGNQPEIVLKGTKKIHESPKKPEKPEENETFFWDPSTVRYKQPRKIIIPKEVQPKNLVDGKEVKNVSFNDILGKLETVPKKRKSSFENVEKVKISNKDDETRSIDPGEIETEDRLKPFISIESFADKDKIDKVDETSSIESGELESEDRLKSSISTEDVGQPSTSKEVENRVASSTYRDKIEDEKTKKKHKREKRKKHRERDKIESCKKKKRNNVVDGEEIEGLVKKEKSKKIREEAKIDERKDLSERQDEYVLMQLFNKGK